MRTLRLIAVGLAGMMAGCSSPLDRTVRNDLKSWEDGEWITVTGKVVSRSEKRFELLDGKRLIMVEVDDYGSHIDKQPFDANAETPLALGDRVTVRGAVDRDLHEEASIEAHTVEVHDRNAKFFGNPADDEGGNYGLFLTRLPPDGTPVSLTGTVMMRHGDMIVVDNGRYRLNVDIDDATIPRDLRVGDPVTVLGELQDPLLGSRHLAARTVVHAAPD